MSSFIVDRKEFIKAAGLMCGYEEAKRDSHKWFVDNVRKEFEHAYALNVISYNKQYEDDVEPETEKYDEVFNAYRKKGALIQRDGYSSGNGVVFTKTENVMNKNEFRRSMFNFFNSVLYQIEDDAAHRAVAELFYSCLSHLYADEIRHIEGWWGVVDLAA